VIFRSEGAEFFGVLSIAFSYTSPNPARGTLAKAVEIAAFLKNCRLEVGLAIECELRFAKKLGYERPCLHGFTRFGSSTIPGFALLEPAIDRYDH
jgi:hypothetical protein